jgi:alkane 1-monooxygenase
MLTYLRFGLINLFQLTALGLMLSGGPWLWLFAGLVVVFPSLDNVLADDRYHPAYQQSWLLNALLYLNLPILLLLTVLFGYLISGSDPLSLGLISGQTFGFDLAARRGNITTVELVTSGLALGLFYGAAGINVAHELIHRLNRPLDLLFGRWLLAFTWDTTFAIEHIHGHHVHVATMTDPATARRGEYILKFVLRSTVQSFTNAFRHEAMRLAKAGRSAFGFHNKALTGQFMSLAIAGLYYLLAGWWGVAVFLMLAANGKLYLEAVNYIEHYGLVRIAGRPVRARHSWDCYRVISAVFLYNLPRHADHHLAAAKPFWRNRVNEDAPVMPYGYVTMLLAAVIPPVWLRLTDPLLADWDNRFASTEERNLIAKSQ